MSQSNENDPNLTPILDMVFQLITFFMLVVSFKDHSVERDLKLPAIGSAVAVDTRDATSQLVLNINARGELIVFGVKRDDVEKYFRNEGASAKTIALRENPAYQPGQELPTTVVLRIDEACDYGAIDGIVRLAQSHGFLKFMFNSATGQSGKRP